MRPCFAPELPVLAPTDSVATYLSTSWDLSFPPKVSFGVEREVIPLPPVATPPPHSPTKCSIVDMWMPGTKRFVCETVYILPP